MEGITVLYISQARNSREAVEVERQVRSEVLTPKNKMKICVEFKHEKDGEEHLLKLMKKRVPTVVVFCRGFNGHKVATMKELISKKGSPSFHRIHLGEDQITGVSNIEKITHSVLMG